MPVWASLSDSVARVPHLSETKAFQSTNGPKVSMDRDEEGGSDAHFQNKSIRSFLWTGVTVKVEDRRTKQQKAILSNVDGMVREGELMTVMGPS